jgi:RsiW-degrading membrane proteinase PrsW (M82 family)
MFEAFHEKDFQLVVSSFMLGYGILFFFSESYLTGLKPTNLIVQSTAVGSVFNLFPLYLYRRSLNFEGLNEEKSEEKYSWVRENLLLASISLGIVLTVLRILL